MISLYFIDYKHDYNEYESKGNEQQSMEGKMKQDTHIRNNLCE